MKIYYCPPKPGDVWPPVESRSTGKPVAFASNDGAKREKSVKPAGCCKLFMGNLSCKANLFIDTFFLLLMLDFCFSDNIDDESIMEFFKDCCNETGGEMVGLRWLTHMGSGDFKGCGYAEFSDTRTADLAFAKDGSMLLGRYV